MRCGASPARNPIGWIFCGVGLLYQLHHFALAYALQQWRTTRRCPCSHPVALRQPREGVLHDLAVRLYEKSRFIYNALRRSPNTYHNGHAIAYENSFPKAIGER